MTLNPDEIERMKFTVVKRGYDTAEVDTFMVWLGDTIRADDDFTRAGTEVATALRRLHRSVLDIQTVAEEEAAEMLARSREEAERLRTEADEYATEVRTNAEAAAIRMRDDMLVEAEAQHASAAAEHDRLVAEARERLTDAQRILSEAEERARVAQADSDTYLESVTVLAEQSARARALAAVQELRDDLARLVYERETVRAQLRQLRTAIASAIEMAAGGEVDLTNSEPGIGEPTSTDQPLGVDQPDPVDSLVDQAVTEALAPSPRQARPF